LEAGGELILKVVFYLLVLPRLALHEQDSLILNQMLVAFVRLKSDYVKPFFYSA